MRAGQLADIDLARVARQAYVQFCIALDRDERRLILNVLRLHQREQGIALRQPPAGAA